MKCKKERRNGRNGKESNGKINSALSAVLLLQFQRKCAFSTSTAQQKVLTPTFKRANNKIQQSPSNVYIALSIPCLIRVSRQRVCHFSSGENSLFYSPTDRTRHHYHQRTIDKKQVLCLSVSV